MAVCPSLNEQHLHCGVHHVLSFASRLMFAHLCDAGLDARAAAIVMRCVRNTVNTGRTVVCTIHQPSIDIFEAFDDLLLMKSGGFVTYHGSLGKHSCKLIAYFEVSSKLETKHMHLLLTGMA